MAAAGRLLTGFSGLCGCDARRGGRLQPSAVHPDRRHIATEVQRSASRVRAAMLTDRRRARPGIPDGSFSCGWPGGGVTGADRPIGACRIGVRHWLPLRRNRAGGPWSGRQRCGNVAAFGNAVVTRADRLPVRPSQGFSGLGTGAFRCSGRPPLRRRPPGPDPMHQAPGGGGHDQHHRADLRRADAPREGQRRQPEDRREHGDHGHRIGDVGPPPGIAGAGMAARWRRVIAIVHATLLDQVGPCGVPHD